MTDNIKLLIGDYKYPQDEWVLSSRDDGRYEFVKSNGYSVGTYTKNEAHYFMTVEDRLYVKQDLSQDKQVGDNV